MTLLYFINGILGNTTSGWQEQFEWYVDDHTAATGNSCSYWIGPLRWGMGKVVKDAIARLRGVRDAGANSLPRYERIIVATHSNGGEVIVRALKEDPTLRIDQLHLIAAACDGDFEKNGLNAALRAYVDSGGTQGVGQVICYVSESDEALWVAKWFGWLIGYGQLGKAGPKNHRGAVGIIRSDSYKHGDWVYAHGSETLATILRYAGVAVTP